MQSPSLFQYNEYHYSYDYDYIFTGAGAAGLSLLMRMLLSGRFKDKTFLLVDRDRKDRNDRTWCFWERGEGLFEEIVYKSWERVKFHGPGFSKEYAIAPFKYKMIRGIDFYNHCLNYIKQQENVRLLFEPVYRVENQSRSASLMLNNGELYFARQYLFNSILFEDVKTAGAMGLKQHFKGWMIETETPFFDPGVNTLMDFRVDQRHGTTFVYVMPLDERKALVEYTLFTDTLLNHEEYELGLKQYIHDFLKIENYAITEKEFGVIPMSDQRYHKGEGRVVHIGTAGGYTKSSSGYTFQFIQKNSSDMVHTLINHGTPRMAIDHSGRFRFYDRVLLNVLRHGELPGAELFTRLFRRNPIRRIFRFLDNDSMIPEELLLIGSLPTKPFLKAACRVL